MQVVLSVKISIYGLFTRFDSKEFVLPGPVTGALKGFTVLKNVVNVVL